MDPARGLTPIASQRQLCKIGVRLEATGNSRKGLAQVLTLDSWLKCFVTGNTERPKTDRASQFEETGRGERMRHGIVRQHGYNQMEVGVI